MRNGKKAAMALGMTAWMAGAALAQSTIENGVIPLPEEELTENWMQQGLIVLAVVVVLALVAGIVMLVIYRNRQPEEMEGMYLEPAVVGSKFEQLLSEIQGLSLRVQGGESKGYYRKIEQLVRVFLERIGYQDARHMSDEEIEALLGSGEIQQDIAQALTSIFERCKQGAIHESEKLDFSAAELLRDLRTIIKRSEGVPTRT